jgi:hypothetical protein
VTRAAITQPTMATSFTPASDTSSSRTRLPQCAVLDMRQSDEDLRTTAVRALSGTLTPVLVACNCGLADAARRLVEAARAPDGHDLAAVAAALHAR